MLAWEEEGSDPRAQWGPLAGATTQICRTPSIGVLIAEEIPLPVALLGARMRLPPDALCMPLPYARDRGSGGDEDNNVARERILSDGGGRRAQGKARRSKPRPSRA